MPTTTTTRPRTRTYPLYPHLRRLGAVGITRNGSCCRTYSCVCGAQDSMSAKWPMPAHVGKFIRAHERTCGAELVRAQGIRDAGNPAYLAEEEILLLDGMSTLTAARMTRGVPIGTRAYRASWLSGAEIHEGVIALRGNLGSVHAATLPAACRILDRRAAERVAEEAQARADRYHAAIRAQLARGEAGELGHIVVAVADSLAAGNCATGTEAWIAAHLPGRESATVAEILACGDRSEPVMRAVLRAVRRAGAEHAPATACA